MTDSSIPSHNFLKNIKITTAIHWYQKGEISEKKAAQIAGLNHQEFLSCLAKEKMNFLTVDDDEIKQEVSSEKQKFIRSLRGKYKNNLISSEDFSRQKQLSSRT